MIPKDQILQFFGARIRELRKQRGMSQEELSFECHLDRTYISQVEQGRRNICLQNINAIADALHVSVARLFSEDQPDAKEMPKYRVRERHTISCGFLVPSEEILLAAMRTGYQLGQLPSSFYQVQSLKTLSTLVGHLFCDDLAKHIGVIVNPIEKGHPDIIPVEGQSATEAELRNYPQGLEVKVTVGNLITGTRLEAGTARIDKLTGLTWQAHHREVESLLGLVVDFAGRNWDRGGGRSPIITAAFFAEGLSVADWGEISGTTGRNTKVTGMLSSGKSKMGKGWQIILDSPHYIRKYGSILKFTIE